MSILNQNICIKYEHMTTTKNIWQLYGEQGKEEQHSEWVKWTTGGRPSRTNPIF